LRSTALIVLAAALAACGEGDGSTDPAANAPPTISGTPATSVVANSAYSFEPEASDPDGDALLFDVDGLPGWADFDSITGQLSGVPTDADVGTYKGIIVRVTDGTTDTPLPAFDIVVGPVVASANESPTIEGTPAADVEVDSLYSFQPTASDPEGDALTFSVRNRPAWAAFDSSSGLLQGTPTASSVGTYSDIVISVFDGHSTVSMPPFSVRVSTPGTNSAPTISGAPATSVAAGAPYAFTPTAGDADGDTLSFSVTGKPAWAAFDTATGRLSGTPGSGDVGSYGSIAISVSDGQASASLPAFSIEVTAAPAANSAPTISGNPPTTVTQDTAYTFTPTANDADGDTLTFSIQAKPSWASFSASTGQLSGTPGAGDVGTSGNIVISVTDGAATSSLAAFSITVEAVSMGSATLSWTAPTQRTDGSALTNLAGFKVYWGKQQGSYTNQVTLDNPGITTYVVDNLASGTWYFVTTAFDTGGVESGFSNAASKTIP
jgi:hypothetical protein